MSKSEVQAEAAGRGRWQEEGAASHRHRCRGRARRGRCGRVVPARRGQEGRACRRSKAVAKTPPTFFTLDPFVVNLAGEVQHYLQVGIDLKIADEHVKDQIKAHLPEIRNGVLLLLSSKQVDELASLEGKNRLRAEIREAVNQPLGHPHACGASRSRCRAEGGGGGEAHAAEARPAAAGAAQRAGRRRARGPADIVRDPMTACAAARWQKTSSRRKKSTRCCAG